MAIDRDVFSIQGNHQNGNLKREKKGLTTIKAAALPLCCQQKSFRVG
jgi:hypothetical protein